MEKIRVNKCAAQGDVLFMRVNELPSGLDAPKVGRAVVAHSETGHHHICESPCAEYFVDPKDPFTAYLQLAEDSDVVHVRPFDTHQTLTLPAGSWMVRRQREYVPGGYRRVED
jgi:hypothetical protein